MRSASQSVDTHAVSSSPDNELLIDPPTRVWRVLWALALALTLAALWWAWKGSAREAETFQKTLDALAAVVAEAAGERLRATQLHANPPPGPQAENEARPPAPREVPASALDGYARALIPLLGEGARLQIVDQDGQVAHAAARSASTQALHGSQAQAIPGTPLRVRILAPPPTAWRAQAWALGLLGLSLLGVLLAAHWHALRQWRAREREAAQLRALGRSAAQASESKSRFLASMSHEIRTPMNGILGMAQLQLMDNTSEAECKRYARTILDSGETLVALLNDILDLSKVEAGKLDLAPMPMSPDIVIREVVALFIDRAAAKGLMLSGHWSGPPDACYEADVLRLRQMLTNLVSNAIKFTPSGFVRIKGVVKTGAQGRPMLRFSVADSGEGLSREQQARLFAEYAQAETSISQTHGGTGLGLSIVRQLARLMGGEAGVSSRPGRGSQFWFRIPARSVRVGQPAAAEAMRESGASLEPGAAGDAADGAASESPPSTSWSDYGPHVLVVEDNPINRILLEAMLTKLGIYHHSVENGRAALEWLALRDLPPDLVLMDIQMPVMDGIEATLTLRHAERQRGKPGVPVVALTANAYESERAQYLDAGMNDVITKPVQLQQLMRVLQTYTAYRSRTPPASATPEGA